MGGRCQRRTPGVGPCTVVTQVLPQEESLHRVSAVFLTTTCESTVTSRSKVEQLESLVVMQSSECTLQYWFLDQHETHCPGWRKRKSSKADAI